MNKIKLHFTNEEINYSFNISNIVSIEEGYDPFEIVQLLQNNIGLSILDCNETLKEYLYTFIFPASQDLIQNYKIDGGEVI